MRMPVGYFGYIINNIPRYPTGRYSLLRYLVRNGKQKSQESDWRRDFYDYSTHGEGFYKLNASSNWLQYKKNQNAFHDFWRTIVEFQMSGVCSIKTPCPAFPTGLVVSLHFPFRRISVHDCRQEKGTLLSSLPQTMKIGRSQYLHFIARGRDCTGDYCLLDTAKRALHERTNDRLLEC